MKQFTFTIIALLISGSFSIPANPGLEQLMKLREPKTDYGNANFYVDLVLFNINRQLPDTIPLPDVGGVFNFHNCIVFGFEQGVKRDGDATLVVADQSARFVMSLRMLDVGMSCDWRFMLANGYVSGSSAKVGLTAGLAWLLEHGQHPYLTDFRVTTLEPITTEVTGALGLGWLIEDIADSVIAGFEDQLVYVIENQVRDVFQGILDNMVIP